MFTMLSTMSQAYSLGAPLPPNGGGATSPLPRPIHPALLGPFLPRPLVVGGIQLVAPPPPSSSLLSGLGSAPPSLSSVTCARRAHCCLGGALPSPSCSGGVIPSLSLSCRLCARRTRCCLGGAPPSPVLWLRAGGAHRLIGLSPPVPCLYAGNARCWVGGPPSPPVGCTH